MHPLKPILRGAASALGSGLAVAICAILLGIAVLSFVASAPSPWRPEIVVAAGPGSDAGGGRPVAAGIDPCGRCVDGSMCLPTARVPRTQSR